MPRIICAMIRSNGEHFASALKKAGLDFEETTKNSCGRNVSKRLQANFNLTILLATALWDD